MTRIRSNAYNDVLKFSRNHRVRNHLEYLSFFCSCFYRREVLPAAIKTLKDGGYRLVSVAECLGKEAYLKDPPPLPKVSRFATHLQSKLSNGELLEVGFELQLILHLNYHQAWS